jgi:hypothetical protein
MPTTRLTDRRAVVIALALVLIGLAACWVCSRQIQSTRHALVERRLVTAVDILRESATRAVSEPDTLPDFVADLQEWGRVTGLRLTLILDDGSVLADTELSNMPNLGDRPEVAAARDDDEHGAFRRSALTGKDTLYIAKRLEKDGARIGVLRAATYASEVDAALSGIEITFAGLSLCCAGVGVVLGLIAGRRMMRGRSEPAPRTEPVSRTETEPERIAA